MNSPVASSHLFFQDETPRAAGRLTLSGTLHHSGGIGRDKPRILGRYALVYLVSGAGFYREKTGFKASITPGDAILVFPEIPHAYGPRPKNHWDEIYVVFDGSIFDCWRQSGLISPRSPIHRAPNAQKWFDALRELLSAPRPANDAENLFQLSQFQAILSQMLRFPTSGKSDDWLARAKGRLEANLGEKLDTPGVAAEVGQSYENFRKRFAQEVGISPARYRAQKRFEAARTLLLTSEMTHSSIARSLGFNDEFHFSKQFKSAMGLSPRAWLQKIEAEESPLEGY